MLTRHTRALTVCVGAMLLASCWDLEAPAPPTQRQLVVHAILDASAMQQWVRVELARTGNGPPSPNFLTGQEPVTGAFVWVTAPDGTMMPANGNDPDVPPGWYGFGLAKRLVPGATYTLHIYTPAGEEVTGSTTIPMAKPFERDTFPHSIEVFYRERDTLSMSWPRTTGAAGYEVDIQSAVTDYTFFADTVIAIPGLARTIDNDAVFPEGNRVLVLISAVDSAYYEYYRVPSDPFAGVPPGRLKGAVGVFGSIVPMMLRDLGVR